MKYLSSNTGIVLKKLIFLLIIYAACRVLFYAFNYSYFADLPLLKFIAILFQAVYFDASTVIILNFLFILLFLLPVKARENSYWQSALKWLFVVVNSIALLANCADLVYFQFTHKRTTSDVFSFFGGGIGNDVFRLLPYFIKDYWYIFLIWIFFTWLLIFGYNRTGRQMKIKWNKNTYTGQSLLFLLNIAIAIVLSRGGLQLRPTGITTAGEFVESKYVPLLLNSPFSIMKTFEVRGIEPKEYFSSEDEMKILFDPYHAGETGEFKKLNVMLIALESFSKEYVGSLNGNKKGYTPFLDSLIGNSLVFTNAFSNGKKSIEGIPALVAGIPSWSDEPFITSRYGNNQISSLANILGSEGYNTSFFHGGTNGTMGFDAFAGLAGYDDYYGRSEYKNEKDFDGSWGIWDEEFMQYTAKMLSKKPQPFFSTLFTLTSHHPFAVPERYKGRFDKGTLEIHQTIGYTDNALRLFFETAKTADWYKNTLFVITADHTGISEDPFYSNRIGNFTVPLIYYLPGSELKGVDSTFTQHIDIMPTILDYLNYPKPYFCFGNSAFDKNADHYAFTYNSGFHELIENYYVSQFADNKNTDLYYFRADSLLNNNINSAEKERVKYMELKSKAIIQTYEQCLINNRMTIRK